MFALVAVPCEKRKWMQKKKYLALRSDLEKLGYKPDEPYLSLTENIHFQPFFKPPLTAFIYHHWLLGYRLDFYFGTSDGREVTFSTFPQQELSNIRPNKTIEFFNHRKTTIQQLHGLAVSAVDKEMSEIYDLNSSNVLDVMDRSYYLDKVWQHSKIENGTFIEDIYEEDDEDSLTSLFEPLAGDEEKLKAIFLEQEKHALECIDIEPFSNKPDHVLSSRFGGQGYWTKGLEYPVNKNGDPLSFLAQINFAELPENDLYPHEGLLQFFIDNESMGKNYDIVEANDKRVIENKHLYHIVFQETMTDEPIGMPSSIEEALPLGGEYSLGFKVKKDPLDFSDYRWLRKISVDDELSDYIEERLCESSTSTGSKMGGYAFFTQGDPRMHFDIAKKELNHDWLLLLQIDTSDKEDVHIMWGDGGVGNFFIREDHLANRDFSKVWFTWDCC